jgi:hypothetical protein
MADHTVHIWKGRWRWTTGVVTGLIVHACAVTGAAAQAQSRADEIAAKQAEKATRLQPYEPSRIEQVFSRVERRFTEPPPWAVSFESVYAGGGMTAGVRYSRPYADRAGWFATALYSIHQYKLLELGTTSPGHLGGRLDLSARGGWRDATQVGFYGLGMATSDDDRANYRFQEPYAEGVATYRPTPWVPITGRLSYERYHLESGKGGAPSIETVHTPSTAPGLGDSPKFVHAAVDAGIDTRRPSPGYARSGGYYGIAFHHFADLDETYTFDRVDAELVQHVPILRETWVITVRTRLQSTIGDDSVVPYFLLPSVGGGRTLRAYSSWRFRDRHAVVANLEWRWIPSRLGLDMALFCDIGTVSGRRADLDFQDAATDCGVGGRFHAPRRDTFLRIEVAKGSEGWKLVFGSSAAF